MSTLWLEHLRYGAVSEMLSLLVELHCFEYFRQDIHVDSTLP